MWGKEPSQHLALRRIPVKTRTVATIAVATLGLGGAMGGAVVSPSRAASPQAPGRVMGVRSSVTSTSLGPAGVVKLNGKPTFPISLNAPPPMGSTTPQGGDGLDAVVKAGINLFRTDILDATWGRRDAAYVEAWDAAAAQRGIHTLIPLHGLALATPDSASDRELHTAMKGLLAAPSAAGIGIWYSRDEPFWSGVAPQALRFAYCMGTGRGPSKWCAGEHVIDGHHLWLTVQAPNATAAQLAPYSRVTDMHGADVYPVSLAGQLAGISPNLHAVGQWVKTMQSVTPNHAVWSTLQLCSSESYSQTGGSAYLLPSRIQERYMIYDAIINGARGLAFYGGNNAHCWNATDSKYHWNWGFWNKTLQPLVRQISASSPLGPALVNPASTKRLDPHDTQAEAISRTVKQADGSTVLWVLTAQNSDQAGRIKITNLPKGVSQAIAYTEGRTVKVRNRTLVDSVGPWGVHVYKLVIPAKTASAPATRAIAQ